MQSAAPRIHPQTQHSGNAGMKSAARLEATTKSGYKQWQQQEPQGKMMARP